MRQILLIPLLLLMACGGVATSNNTAKSQKTTQSEAVNIEPINPPLAPKVEPKIENLPDSIVIQDSLFLLDYLPLSEIEYTDHIERQKIVKYIKEHKIGTRPYRSIKKINAELNLLFDLPDLLGYGWQSVFLIERLKFHLSNPLTYKNKIESIPATSSPDGLLKFYSLDMGLDIYGPHYHYLQYADSKGAIQVIEMQSSKNGQDHQNEKFIDIYQFSHKGITYYVFKTLARASVWHNLLLMDIATFKDGELTYHNQFVPTNFRRTGDCAIICQSEDYAQNEAAYTFNPKTRTINYTSFIDGKIEKGTTKLILP